ncbi:uncharacterized protein [Drosophila pseudoobscura]|uniref:Uncharacterized protein isoform X2 n=1 Tax=Drosophila pseudoobscura pseudoobscura TaxID=46245 RepID=A0A6I8VVV9_DROPS|nr:uncharacterized protein LOC26532503 isoform X2 [Drosophila pseudoobscura]
MLMATAIGPSISPIWQELDGEIGVAAAGEAALSEAWQRQPVVWMLLATAIGPSNFAHLAGIGWRNWCGNCWRGSSIGGVAGTYVLTAACGLDVVGDGDRAFKFRPFGRNWMAKLVWQLLERQLYRRRGRYVWFCWLLWTCAVDCQERRQ